MMQATSSKQASSMDDKGSKCVNVQVVVRTRPLNAREIDAKDTTAITCSPHTKEITFTNPKASGSKTYTFDAVYGPNSSQTELFDQTVRPIVDEVLKGFNCTLFAYGQTVRVSHLELYNEELRDLLSNENKQLRIYDGLMDTTGKKGCTVNNLEEVIVSNAQSIFTIMDNSRKRQTAETLLSPNSSRSHCIFTITIHTKEATPEGEDLLKVGKLNLVDLAGSENILRSGTGGDRKREAGMINTSLLTLGRVITALTEHSSHIPYRESKLTRLLQDSLGGKTKTCVIATVSPSAGSVEETQSTLDYAHRAKNIRNRPEVNQKMTKKALIKEYTAEIENLKVLLRSARDKNGVYVPTETFENMEAELLMRRNQVGDVEQMLEKREAELEVLKASVGEKVVELEAKDKLIILSKEELEKTTHQLEETETQYNKTKDTLKQTQNTLTSHKEYEQVLRSNLDMSLHDRDQLFNKIDRKKTVESVNKNKVEHARGVLLERVQALEHAIGQANSRQAHFYDDVEGCIAEFLQRKDEMHLPNCTNHLHQQIQALHSQTGALALLVSSASQNLAALSKEMQSKSEHSTSLLLTYAQQHSTAWLNEASGFYQESTKAVAAMREIIVEQSAELRLWATTQMNSIKNQSKATSTFMAQQSAALQHISDQASSASTQQQTRLREHQTTLNSFADSQVSSLQVWQSDFMQQIGNVIRNSVEQRSQALRDEVASLTSEYDSDLTDMEKFKHTMVSSVDAAMVDVSQFAAASKTFSDHAEGEVAQFLEHHDKRTTGYAHEVNKLSTRSDEFMTQCNASRQVYSQTMLDKTHEKLVNNTKTGVDTLQSQLDAQISSLHESVSKQGTVLSEKIGFAASHTKSAQVDIHSGTDAIRKDVATLFSLKEDLPTGVTPIKKPIPIPNLEQFNIVPHFSAPLPTPTTPVTPTQPSTFEILPTLQLPLNTTLEAGEDVKTKKLNPTSSSSTSTSSTSTSSSSTTKTSKIPKLQDKRAMKVANKENLVNAR